MKTESRNLWFRRGSRRQVGREGIEPSRGVTLSGFSCHYSFRYLRWMQFVVWTMPLPLAPSAPVRQEPSSLYTFYFGGDMTRRKYTDEQLIFAIRQSRSLRQALARLGLKEAGSNYATLRRRISELPLDTSHMTGQTWNKGTFQALQVATEDYPKNLRPIHTALQAKASALARRIL